MDDDDDDDDVLLYHFFTSVYRPYLIGLRVHENGDAGVYVIAGMTFRFDSVSLDYLCWWILFTSVL